MRENESFDETIIDDKEEYDRQLNVVRRELEETKQELLEKTSKVQELEEDLEGANQDKEEWKEREVLFEEQVKRLEEKLKIAERQRDDLCLKAKTPVEKEINDVKMKNSMLFEKYQSVKEKRRMD